MSAFVQGLPKELEARAHVGGRYDLGSTCRAYNRPVPLPQNQSRRIPKPLHSSRRDQQGAATLHPGETGHSNSGFAAVCAPEFRDS
jgi:hypothetical protein